MIVWKDKKYMEKTPGVAHLKNNYHQENEVKASVSLIF